MPTSALLIASPQGFCADVQQVVYENVLNKVLTEGAAGPVSIRGKEFIIYPR